MESTLRGARSFRPRRRGLPPTRQKEYEQLVAVWSLAADGDMLDLSEVFGRPSPRVVLDIGFGGGEGLVAMAAARPEECLVGVEVHTPGVAGVLDAVAVGGWDHVRVVQADVLDFMPRLAPGSLHGVRLWFPDPWLKNKQRHRRIVRPEVVARWAELLAVGGCLHIATDITDYARHVERVLVGEPRFAGGIVDRPEWRPVTRFETRGRNEGRAATDLMYERLA